MSKIFRSSCSERVSYMERAGDVFLDPTPVLLLLGLAGAEGESEGEQQVFHRGYLRRPPVPDPLRPFHPGRGGLGVEASELFVAATVTVASRLPAMSAVRPEPPV